MPHESIRGMIYLFVFLAVLTHTSFKGSRVIVSLYAIDLGAPTVAIGLLFSMYALFPVFVSIYAGRVSDRYGARPPMILGAAGLFIGLLLPYCFPSIVTLYVSSALIGCCYIFYTVSMQHTIGTFGSGQDRTRNYSYYALGMGLTALIGPTLTGFSIDNMGYRDTYLMLSVFPSIPLLFFIFGSRWLPRHPVQAKSEEKHRMADLLKEKPLRRALIASGIVETGMELFNFYVPIYGRQIGLTATQIGIILGSFACAMLIVRTAMPHLVKRSSEEGVLGLSLIIGAAACLIFPMLESFHTLMGVAFLFGLGLGCASPLSMVLAYNRAPSGRSGEAMGIRQTVNKGIELVMPVVFAAVGTAFGIVAVFWSNGALLVAGSVLMRADANRRRKGGGAAKAPAEA